MVSIFIQPGVCSTWRSGHHKGLLVLAVCTFQPRVRQLSVLQAAYGLVCHSAARAFLLSWLLLDDPKACTSGHGKPTTGQHCCRCRAMGRAPLQRLRRGCRYAWPRAGAPSMGSRSWESRRAAASSPGRLLLCIAGLHRSTAASTGGCTALGPRRGTAGAHATQPGPGTYMHIMYTLCCYDTLGAACHFCC